MALVAAAGVAAAGSVASSSINASNSKSGGASSSSSANAPWGPQAGYLTQGFQQANDIYNNRTAAGPYSGPAYAGDNSIQQSANANANTYANGLGGSLATTIGENSGTGTGNLQGYGATASGLATGATPLSAALNTSGVQGAQAISGSQTALSQLQQQALSNPTQSLQADAQSYMNSAPVAQELQAVNAPIQQTLSEQTIPGLNRQAAMGGNENSSRAGAAEALAAQGAATAEGSADASIENNAFNTGLNTAANTYEQGLTTSLNSATAGGALGLQTAEGAGNQQLNANAQVGNSVSLGDSQAALSSQLAGNNYSLQSTAGAQQQNDANANIAANENLYNYQQGYQQNLLQGYMQDISGNYGGSTNGTGTTQLGSNPVSAALGGATTGYTLANGSNGGGGAIGSYLNNLFAPSGTTYSNNGTASYAPDPNASYPDGAYVNDGYGNMVIGGGM
jgi:hypothetical protein